MDAIKTARPVWIGISEDIKSGTMTFPNGQNSVQKNSLSSYETGSDETQQKISDAIYQLIQSRQVNLDFKIDHNDQTDGKISLKVINKTSGEVVRDIPVNPDFKMHRVKGIIYRTIA